MTTEIVCEFCNSVFLCCDTCGNDAIDCDCNADDAVLYCFTCNAYVESEIFDYGNSTWSKPLNNTTKSVQQPKKLFDCEHSNHKVTMPDGTIVYASSYRHVRGRKEKPDFGLYLDSVWQPDCVSYYLVWPDGCAPDYYDVAVRTILDVYNKAYKHGMWVEIGCIGGHGRTGTVLACMATLSGLDGFDAVEYVRDVYCENSVETIQQEMFVEDFIDIVRKEYSNWVRLELHSK